MLCHVMLWYAVLCCAMDAMDKWMQGFMKWWWMNGMSKINGLKSFAKSLVLKTVFTEPLAQRTHSKVTEITFQEGFNSVVFSTSGRTNVVSLSRAVRVIEGRVPKWCQNSANENHCFENMITTGSWSEAIFLTNPRMTHSGNSHLALSNPKHPPSTCYTTHNDMWYMASGYVILSICFHF